MSSSTNSDSAASPLSLRVIVTVASLGAFAAGMTRRWLINPLASAFGDLSPASKVAITLAGVVGMSAALWLRRRHERTQLEAQRRAIEHTMTTR